jgi:hypothetical protein
VQNTYKEPVINLSSTLEEEAPILVSSQLEIPVTMEHKGPELKHETGQKPEARGSKPLSLAEKFREEPTLYDKISKGREDNSLAARMQRKPVPDLKAAIGINEKFSFISHLFKGDASEYLTTVDYVNTCPDIRSALAYLNDHIVGKYAWDQNNPHVHEFFDLVERRFL